MILSYAKVMQEEGFEPSRNLVVEAQDVDILCTYMTFVQLALYDIPAKVVNGNTLLKEENIVLYTPAYFIFTRLLEEGNLNTQICKYCGKEIEKNINISSVNRRFKVCKECYELEQRVLVLKDLIKDSEKR